MPFSFQTALGFDVFNIHDVYYGIKNFQDNVIGDYFLEPGDYLK